MPPHAKDATHESAGTSHFVVVDAAGNVVSMTTTVESVFGSNRVVGGFVLNNQLTDFSFEPTRDGKPVAMSPDLICVLDSVAGEAVGTETIRYGQRVTVIALPPPPVVLSDKGLQHVGPRAFGYDIDFKSVFA